MTKKGDYKNILVRLPAIYIKMIDEDAKRQFKSRTQIIRDWLKAKCLRVEP